MQLYVAAKKPFYRLLCYNFKFLVERFNGTSLQRKAKKVLNQLLLFLCLALHLLCFGVFETEDVRDSFLSEQVALSLIQKVYFCMFWFLGSEI